MKRLRDGCAKHRGDNLHGGSVLFWVDVYREGCYRLKGVENNL